MCYVTVQDWLAQEQVVVRGHESLSWQWEKPMYRGIWNKNNKRMPTQKKCNKTPQIMKSKWQSAEFPLSVKHFKSVA